MSDRNLRIVPRLDVKQGKLIKGVQMEGWRKVGDPVEFAKLYSETGADEMIFMDVVASLYGRNGLHEVVEQVASEVFVPLTVGGGVRTLDDVASLLQRGADKITLNTAAIDRPELISEIADAYGSQAVVVCIEAIEREGGRFEALTDNGRNLTGIDVHDWAEKAAALGAGELMITSINRDGRGDGYELGLLSAIAERVSVPVIASGGLGAPEDLSDLVANSSVSAACVAQALHWKKLEMADLRRAATDSGCFVRDLI